MNGGMKRLSIGECWNRDFVCVCVIGCLKEVWGVQGAGYVCVENSYYRLQSLWGMWKEYEKSVQLKNNLYKVDKEKNYKYTICT